MKKYLQWISASVMLGIFMGVLMAWPETMVEFLAASGFATLFWMLMLMPVLSADE